MHITFNLGSDHSDQLHVFGATDFCATADEQDQESYSLYFSTDCDLRNFEEEFYTDSELPISNITKDLFTVDAELASVVDSTIRNYSGTEDVLWDVSEYRAVIVERDQYNSRVGDVFKNLSQRDEFSEENISYIPARPLQDNNL